VVGLALNIKPSGIPVWELLLENLSSFRVDSYPIWSYISGVKWRETEA